MISSSTNQHLFLHCTMGTLQKPSGKGFGCCWYVYYSDARLLTPIELTQRAHRWRPTPGPPPVIPGPESRPAQAALSRLRCSGLRRARHCFRSLGPHRGRVGRDEYPSPEVSPLCGGRGTPTPFLGGRQNIGEEGARSGAGRRCFLLFFSPGLRTLDLVAFGQI